MGNAVISPVKLQAVAGNDKPEVTPELKQLYRDFEQELLVPLWTEIGDLMPQQPKSKASPHIWRWKKLWDLASKAGDLVPVGRGGERRAIGLANPSLGGHPYATPTLWAAIQYLLPGENAPEHRHTQHAFRFVVEGEGVWTVVNGDSIRMSRGDFLPQAGWNWHAHYNAASAPMAWIDGLDIPYSYYTESQFFEMGAMEIRPQGEQKPEFSRSERLWGYSGLKPLGVDSSPVATPLFAYRWENTDRALKEQLLLAKEGYKTTVSAGHAAVRYTNPASGSDVLPTIRAEMHRLAPGATTISKREVGSSVFQVFDGRGTVKVGDYKWDVSSGDMFVVPSWVSFSAHAENDCQLDLFRFSDTPIYEALHSYRTINE